ncbi:hypothetical protein NP493_296g01003 [Ridgeia piscesae]|uniref:Uncharacterized protein n=1 Tax=Ridgeia piscesae TaxID=27915 RepID=A0AAD9NWI5_RIDPI|nr:hypothetical protein NP493_296g01003 [Ridgeia piscesae]
MPKPSKKSGNCTLDLLPDLTRGGATDVKMISLFEQKRVRGFWPCYNDVSGTRELTMELELLTMEEAEQRPVGVGRDEPNQHPFLDEPK